MVRCGLSPRPKEDAPTRSTQCDLPGTARNAPQDARLADHWRAARGRTRSYCQNILGSEYWSGCMSATAVAARPFIGLRYFEEHDAHLFYGRDEQVAELLGKVAQNRFVAVVGSSGCG